MRERLKDELRHEVVNGLLSVKGIVMSSGSCIMNRRRGRFLPDRDIKAIHREVERAISALDRFLKAFGP